MASCDFSTSTYSYDDYEGDFQMENFSLAKEDFQLKIPLMLSAIKMSKRNLTFFGSPWASPAWMKTNGKMQGPGQLKGVAGDKYHKAWALYFAMFIKAYEDNGVNIWGLTVENEPSAGYMKGYGHAVTLRIYSNFYTLLVSVCKCVVSLQKYMYSHLPLCPTFNFPRESRV